MSEQTHKIEQKDIIVPQIKTGETALVLQRHGRYDRDRAGKRAGSLFEDSAASIKSSDEEWFRQVLSSPGDREKTYVLFVSSDTQYADNGFRSLETGQLAQEAAWAVMEQRGVDPAEHIINFNPNYKTARSDDTHQDIRPIPGLREPDIFNPRDKAYVRHLQETYGYADPDTKTGLSPEGWAVHEMDAAETVRNTTGAEGQEDLIHRTKTSLALLERYARVWHASNPGKKLIIWATSHYDTINPLVKEVDGRLKNDDGSLTDEYQPVDYGGGVVIKFPSVEGGHATLETRVHHGRAIEIGREATAHSVTRLGQPRY